MLMLMFLLMMMLVGDYVFYESFGPGTATNLILQNLLFSGFALGVVVCS